MRAVVQRVKQASVRTEGHYAEIGGGMLILLGVAKGDGEKEAAWLAKKLSSLRIFEDSAGKMNLSLKDVGGEALVVSQFTLLADLSRGRRPGFDRAAPPKEAEELYGRFVELLRAEGVPVQTGVFGARMEVALVNDGPVTLVIDRPR